jgi:hypothetical protein
MNAHPITWKGVAGAVAILAVLYALFLAAGIYTWPG